MEVLRLERAWIDRQVPRVRLPATKSGTEFRAICQPALALAPAQPCGGEDNPYVFPSEIGAGHFIRVVRFLERFCLMTQLKDVTAHVLLHTFASVADTLDSPS